MSILTVTCLPRISSFSAPAEISSVPSIESPLDLPAISLSKPSSSVHETQSWANNQGLVFDTG